MASKARGPFSPALFGFLSELATHNDRAWFAANKERYERDVREPALAFIRALGPGLAKISKHFVADPRPMGGSLMRIYRDTRFAKDKSPYKTNVGIQFRHARGKDVHAPGYYLHLAPGEVFIGVGLWHPEPDALERIRQAVADNGKGWLKATRGGAFGKALAMSGDSLKRPPKGFDPEHPLIEELKRKDFIAIAELGQRDATAPGFSNELLSRMRAGSPMMKFLTAALDLPF